MYVYYVLLHIDTVLWLIKIVRDCRTVGGSALPFQKVWTMSDYERQVFMKSCVLLVFKRFFVADARKEYAVGEKNQEEFRRLRVRDSQVTSVVESTAGPKAIDWSSWDARISNKEVLGCLKSFHEQQSMLLESVLKEDHAAAVQKQTEGWELFDASVQSCQKSVEKSEQILKNGARALWISFQNPPISMLSQSEWLDADQYWQAFVEKHHFYHNHLASAVEDPESKDYDAKNKATLKRNWETFDGRGTTRQNNKLLYQRPSFEYYDVFRGPLIEHMIFYLTKTGGDSRRDRGWGKSCGMEWVFFPWQNKTSKNWWDFLCDLFLQKNV